MNRSCTFIYAFREAFGDLRDQSWFFFCRDQSPKKEIDLTAHISVVYDSQDLSSFRNDSCLRIILVFILLAHI